VEFHQKNHLFCSYLALQSVARQIGAAAVQGESPSGVGGRAAPLPEAEWREIERPLREALEAIGAAVRDLAPALHQDQGRNAEAGTTRVWVAVLLGQALEVVEDLEPERFIRRFGPMPEEESRRLQEATASAKRALEAARRAVRTR